MPASEDALLQVFIKLRDEFSKQYEQMAKAAETRTSRMTRVLRTSFSAIGKGIQLGFKPLEYAGKALLGIGRQLFSLKGLIATVFGGLAVKSIADTAAQIEGMEAGFYNIAKSMGLNAKKMAAALHEGMRGMLADVDAFDAMNKALLLHVADTEEHFELAGAAARRLADVLGIDATQALQNVVDGISRQTTRTLAQIGVIVRAEDAFEAYAKAIGKETTALTDEERVLAFREIVFEKLRQSMGKLGADTDGLSTVFGRFQASMKNLWTDISLELVPAIARAATKMSEWLRDNRIAIRQFAAWIGGVADIIVDGILRMFERIKASDVTIKGILAVLFAEIWDFTSKFVTGFFNALWKRVKIEATTGLKTTGKDIALGISELLTPLFGSIFGYTEKQISDHLDKVAGNIAKDLEEDRRKYIAGLQKISGDLGRMLDKAAEDAVKGLRKIGETAVGQKGIAELILRFEELRERIAGLAGGGEIDTITEKLNEMHAQLEKEPTGISRFFAAIGEGFESFQKAIGSWVTSVAKAVEETFAGLRNTLSDFFFDFMTGELKSLKDYFVAFLHSLARAVSDAMADILLQRDTIKGVIGLVSSAIGSLAGAGGGILGGATGTAPGGYGVYPAHQHGGPLMGGRTYLVGEQGPELFTPPSGGNLVPNYALADTAAGGAVEIHNHITIQAWDTQDVKRGLQKVLPWFNEQIRRDIHIDPHARAFYRGLRR